MTQKIKMILSPDIESHQKQLNKWLSGYNRDKPLLFFHKVIRNGQKFSYLTYIHYPIGDDSDE